MDVEGGAVVTIVVGILVVDCSVIVVGCDVIDIDVDGAAALVVATGVVADVTTAAVADFH